MAMAAATGAADTSLCDTTKAAARALGAAVEQLEPLVDAAANGATGSQPRHVDPAAAVGGGASVVSQQARSAAVQAALSAFHPNADTHDSTDCVAAVMAFLVCGELRQTAADGATAPLPTLLPVLLHAHLAVNRDGIWRQALMPKGPLGDAPPRDWHVFTPHWDTTRKHERAKVHADDRLVIVPDRQGFHAAYGAEALAPGRKHFFAVGLVEDDLFVGVAADGLSLTNEREHPGNTRVETPDSFAAWMVHTWNKEVHVEVALAGSERRSVDQAGEEGVPRKGVTLGVLVDLTGNSILDVADATSDADATASSDDEGDTRKPLHTTGGAVTFFANGVPVATSTAVRSRLPLDGRRYYPSVCLGCCNACVISLGPEDDWRRVTPAGAAAGCPELGPPVAVGFRNSDSSDDSE